MGTESSDQKQKRGPDDLTTAQVPPSGPGGGAHGAGGPMIAGRYEVLERLGEGGMGAVFKVRDHKVGHRLIALKRILQLDDRARSRFESEIHSAANLNHRNICKVHDSGEDDEGPFFTMELLDGGSLADRVADHGPMSHDALMDLVRQLAQALRYAHRKSVQHRDVKPTNVLFAEDGDPKLADFGIARIGAVSGLSVTNIGLGTPGYSAPEQLANAKAADHRADIYGLGATLYFALTGRGPGADPDTADLPAFWRSLIGKCMKKDPSERYFDAGEVLEALEKTPQGSGPGVADGCSVCGAGNPVGSSFCRKCGAGLSEPCPHCGEPNGAGDEVCRHCGGDMTRWWAPERRPVEPRGKRENRDPGQDALRQLEALRDSAIQLESETKYHEAEQTWHRVLDIQPEHRQAVDAIERLRGRTLDERFLKKSGEFTTAITNRELSKATGLLHELRTIAAPAAASQLPQYEQQVDTLRRALILELKEAFDAAVQRRRRKTARAMIGRLSELRADAAEVTVMLERLNSSERGWRRRRTARKLMGSVVLLLLAGGVYLLVAREYNRQVAGDAAAALAEGREPVLSGFLPSWPRYEPHLLVERSRLCRTLDGRYGSGQWRGQIRDIDLFGTSHNSSDLVAEYNWLILRQVAGAALAGSDQDLNHARDLVRKIAWKDLGPRGEPFRQRQEALQEILGGWYDGSLSLEVFADDRLVGEPTLEFVSQQAARITDPQTDCDTIARLARLLLRLGEDEHIPDQVRAHNERVIEAIGDTIDDPRSSRIANLLNHLCLETGDADRARQEAGRALDRLVGDLRRVADEAAGRRPNVIALLVAIDRGMTDPPAALKPAVEQLVGEQTAGLLTQIEEAFEGEGDVAALLARLQDQSAHWSYLGETAAEGLRARESRLRELHERWSGGPLVVAPLCDLQRGEPADRLWIEFQQSTETRALDAFYEEDLPRAADLAGLLRSFDYQTQPLRDLSQRSRVHDALARLAGMLPESDYGRLRRRLFTRDATIKDSTARLTTDVVLAAIESGEFDVALGLVPTIDVPDLAAIARSLSQLEDLPTAALRELEASVLADDRLPESSRRVREQVVHRLDLCLPDSTTLQSPGQLSLGASHVVSRVSVQPRGGAGLSLELLDRGGTVYRVPFLETGPVTLRLEDASGVATSRVFNVVHSMLRNPAEVTIRSASIVAGEPVVLAIRPRLDFERVTVEDVDRTAELADRGDHWVLELVTSLEPGQPAATRQWNLRLVTHEGVQKLELPITVVAPEIVEAREALHLEQYERVFDRLSAFEQRDHDALRHLEHEAGARWSGRLQTSEPATRAEADALVIECGRFLATVPAPLHQNVAAIRDRAWVRRIEMTTTWDTGDALRDDLAFLRGLDEAGDLPRKMTAWLAGAAAWAEPIVQHMQRQPGDWSTVRDQGAGTRPAVLVHRRTGLEFVHVPAGSFGIGGNSLSPQETPHRSVTLQGFYISRTECTRAAWAAGRGDPAPPAQSSRLPIADVPFVEAAAWCHALGLDLPTEAQWELAAAGVDARRYPWGGEECEPNVKRAFRGSDLAEVDSFECDRSPFDVMDMAGNVREWCYPVSNATYRVLVEGTQDPPAWSDGIVVRGASWEDSLKDGRTHNRVFTPGSPTEVGTADPAVGFRPVLSR